MAKIYYIQALVRYPHSFRKTRIAYPKIGVVGKTTDPTLFRCPSSSSCIPHPFPFIWTYSELVFSGSGVTVGLHLNSRIRPLTISSTAAAPNLQQCMKKREMWDTVESETLHYVEKVIGGKGWAVIGVCGGREFFVRRIDRGRSVGWVGTACADRLSGE
jgi:hypothetical protein